MATLKTPKEVFENLCDLDELVECVNNEIDAFIISDDRCSIPVADLEDAMGLIPSYVKAAFIELAVEAGWKASFLRNGGGPEMLDLISQKI